MNQYELSIERAFDTDALSLFNCGVRAVDQLIHKRNGGVLSVVSEVPCEFYVARINEVPAAVFVFSNRTIILNDQRYPCLEIEFMAVRDEWRNKGIGTHIIQLAEGNARAADYRFLTTAAFFNRSYSAVGFYEKCGFEINGDKQGDTIPMFKFLK